MLNHTNQSIPLTKQTKIVLALSILLAISWIGYSYRKPIFELWMRFALRNEHIVVSMTTTPYRISSMRQVIDFVLAENIPLKTIYVNVPYIFKRDNIAYSIPDWLQNYKKVTVLRSRDYGPGTKLLGTLELATLPNNAIIITVDDDIKYPKNILLYLAYKAMRNPNYAVGLSGMNPHYNKHGQIITDSPTGVGLKAVKQNNAFVSILEGFGTIAYRAKFFDSSVFDIENAPRECRNSDDIYLSFYLARNDIPRQVLRSSFMNLEKIAWNPLVGLNQDALHQLHPRPAERHRICVAFLKEQYPGINF